MQDLSQNRGFFDLCPAGIMAVAKNGDDYDILYANSFFGATDGKTLSEVWPGENFTTHLKDGPPQNIMAGLNGRWVKLSFREGSWQDKDAILIWADDVTEFKQSETDLQRAIETADKVAGIKSNFLATMSHEMRTPMQAVFGFLELIALEKPSPAIREMVDIAKASASGMMEILDDILDLMKIDAEKMDLDKFEIPLRTLTRGVVEALSIKAKGKPVTLTDHVADEVPQVILGDPKRLRQILINLTGNALKFTEEGFVKIHVTTKTNVLDRPHKGLILRFEIIDSGVGISKTALSKLFNTFTQADPSTARRFGGTGLGLSISKKLVEVMQGQIGVESREGEGSIFWFEIPTEDISLVAANPNMPDLIGISILSVEDHPQGAKEIVKSLRSMGASVESCPTYTEALDLVKRRPFDVGVIDQGLPDGLGIDLIRAILEIRPFMGLFMYTARDDAGLQHSLQNLGIPYVIKPASRLGLGQKVLEAAVKASASLKDGALRLLIAEDTPSVRDILKRQLKLLNADADFVTNGTEALSALATGQYGILITDLHMPEIDGYRLIETIRAQETDRHMPVIVLTADVQMAQRQVYLEHGFDECLLKPVSLGHLKRLLIRWGLLKQDIDISASPLDAPRTPSSIDMNLLVDQMGAFNQSTKEMLQVFIDTTAILIDRLQETGCDKPAEILKIAHSLKGAARSACAVRLGNIASEIQDMAEQGHCSDTSILDAVSEFARVRVSVQDIVKL